MDERVRTGLRSIQHRVCSAIPTDRTYELTTGPGLDIEEMIGKRRHAMYQPLDGYDPTSSPQICAHGQRLQHTQPQPLLQVDLLLMASVAVRDKLRTALQPRG